MTTNKRKPEPVVLGDSIKQYAATATCLMLSPKTTGSGFRLLVVMAMLIQL